MRAHAVPVKWDGHVILWDAWRPVDTITFCGGVTRYGWRGCRKCKTRILPRVRVGRVLCDGPCTLVLYRCMTCGYTTVLQVDDYGLQEWILDDTDYSDAGSYPTQPTIGVA